MKKEQGSANSFVQDSVINSICEFKYSSKEEVTFAVYFHRYEKVFKKDCTTWSDEKKICLLLGKFRQSEHEKYANYILPRNHLKRLLILKKIFREKSSLFNTRLVLKPDKKCWGYCTTFARIVNRECKKSSKKKKLPLISLNA